MNQFALARSVTVLVVCLLLSCEAAAQLTTRYPCGQYGVPFDPQNFAIGDLNGDSLPDMVVCSTHSSIVAVLIARCEGGYFPAVSYATDSAAVFDVAIGDIDGDLQPDLVLTESLKNNIVVRYNDCHGAFPTSASFSSGASNIPVGIALGDVDGDTRIDAVVASPSSIMVMLNDGSGGLVLDSTISTTLGVAGGGIINLAYLDSDTWLDCVVSGTSTKLAILMGSSTGFGAATTYPYTSSAVAFCQAVGDVDGDGDVDVLLPRDSQLSIMLNDGTGAFSEGPPIMLQPQSDISGADFGDVDGDATGDIVLSDGLIDSVGLLRGLGGGTYAAPVWTSVASAQVIQLADLDDDGELDLAGTGRLAHTVSVALNTGGGILCTPPEVLPGDYATDIALATMNLDANLDLVVADRATNSLEVRLGDGLGGFPTGVTSSVGCPDRILAFEATGDSKVDVIGSNGVAGSVLLYPGNGAGGLSAPTSFTTGAGCMDLVAADVNVDGKRDVVALNRLANTVSVLIGTGTSFLGAATFGIAPSSNGIALGLLDADNVPDLMLIHASPPAVDVWIGNGTGGFAFPTSFPIPAAGTAIVAGDVTGDGDIDAVIAAMASNEVLVLPGNGLGGFSAPIVLPAGQSPVAVQILDVDDNGRLDILAVNALENVSVLAGHGNGVFSAPQFFTAGYRPQAVAWGELNGDGLPDIVTVDGSAPSHLRAASVLLNERIQFCDWVTGCCPGLAGITGIPSLSGEGALVPGTAGSLTLTNAAPSAPALLFVSTSSAPTPFKCGLLCPHPILLILGFATDTSGSIPITWSDWPDGPSGYTLFLQYAVKDAAASCGVSLSNSLRADIP